MQLREHQKEHFGRLLLYLIKHGFAHDGSDTGVGKMHVGAALAAALGQELLVLCPLSIIPAWEETLQGYGAYNYTVINYESAWRRLGQKKVWGKGSYFEFHRRYPLIWFDEAHRCGGEKTINSKMLIAAKRARSTILTQSATIAETPMRMRAFGYAAGLHGLNAPDDSWLHFLLRHKCKPGTFGGWTFSAREHPEVLPQLQEDLYCLERGSRLKKSEIPGFPKMTTEVRLLGDPDKQLTKLSEELLAHYNSRAVEAFKMEERVKAKRKAEVEAAEALGLDAPEERPTGEAMARMMYIRQQLETAKVPLIADMIEDALEDSKVAVFCNFNETIEQLKKIASSRGWTCGVIRGKRKNDEARDLVKKRFQANELDLVICNIQSGGVGLSLHDPVTQIPRTQIICPTFSGVDLKQVLGRSNRDGGGFSRNLLVYFEGSLEGVVARIVRGKLENLDKLNDAQLQGDFRHA